MLPMLPMLLMLLPLPMLWYYSCFHSRYQYERVLAVSAADAAGADAAAVPAAADATLLQLLPLPLPIRTLQQIKQHIITRNENMDIEM